MATLERLQTHHFMSRLDHNTRALQPAETRCEPHALTRVRVLVQNPTPMFPGPMPDLEYFKAPVKAMLPADRLGKRPP